MRSNARRLSTLGECRRNKHVDHVDDDDDGGAMAQIIISKETSKGHGHSHGQGLGLGLTGGSSAPTKDLHYESCCFHYFLARTAASARATPHPGSSSSSQPKQLI